MVEIIRVEGIADAQGDSLIEVRNVGNGHFLLSISFGEDTHYLDGPYLSPELAELDGIGLAEEQGLTRVHVVHSAV